MLDATLQHRVGPDANGVENLVFLQVFVNLGHRERDIGLEIRCNLHAALAIDDRFENDLPVVGARHVPLSQQRPFYGHPLGIRDPVRVEARFGL